MSRKGRTNSEVDPNGVSVEDAATGLLYDIALDPAGVDELLDQWEDLMASVRSGAPFSAELLSHDQNTRAHIARANTIVDRLGAEQSNPIEDALAPYGHVQAVVVGRNLRLLGANKAAIEGFGQSDVPDFLPVHDDDEPLFLDAISAVLKGAGNTVRTHKVEAIRKGRMALVHFKFAGNGMVVIASTEVGWPAGFGPLLAKVFELTPSEIDVARGLLEHGALGEIAIARGRSVGTVRNQVKSLLAKTDTRSQAELVRLLMSMMDVETAAQGVVGLPTEPFVPALADLDMRIVTDAHGRRVTYFVYGDRNGVPILYLSGDVTYLRAAPAAERKIEELGYKIIAPIAPSYGWTDPASDSMDYTKTFVQDVLSIADAAGVTRFPILSSDSDSFYAFHVADMAPQRVTGIVALGAILPFDRPAQIERMDRWQRFLVAAAKHTPQIAPLFVKAAFAMARRLGPRVFLRTVFKSSSPDLRLLDDPEMSRAILAAAPITMIKNGQVELAFLKRLKDSHATDWSNTLDRVAKRIPSHVWHGTHDPMVPAETVSEYRIAHPDVMFRQFDDQGFFLYYSEWEAVLDTLATLVEP